jgi:hypothetical protein
MGRLSEWGRTMMKILPMMVLTKAGKTAIMEHKKADIR